MYPMIACESGWWLWRGANLSLKASLNFLGRLQGTELDELGLDEAIALVDKKAASVAAKKGNKKGQGRVVRDPWKADGFQAFSMQRKKELKSNGDSSKESELAAKLANEWLDLPDKAREDFVKADSKSKSKAKRNGKIPSEAAEQPSSKQKLLTGYQFFCKTRRQELKATGQSNDMKPTDITKLLGAEWQKQSEQQKQDFKEKARHV